MPPGKKGPNAKAVAGNALKAATEEKKKAAEAAKAAKAEAEAWEKGANTRKQSREAETAAKADEAARKRREKEELLAAEEAALGPGGKAKAPPPKKKGGKKKDDLGLLEDALVSAADKKMKKQKAAEKEKKEKQAAAHAAAAAAKPKEELDPLMANTQSMMINDELVGRGANKARMQEEGASGIDEALSILNVGGDGVTLRSAKALYNKFEETMMPVVKEENPGLRMTQYKEKIWTMWKRSPENPANQKKDEA